MWRRKAPRLAAAARLGVGFMQYWMDKGVGVAKKQL
jgi:hypothetical protein